MNWLNTTDAYLYAWKAMAPQETFIKNCRYGITQVVCPKATVSVTLLGFCYTLFADNTSAYVVNQAGFLSAFSFEVDIMHDDYSPVVSSLAAGIRLSENTPELLLMFECLQFIYSICNDSCKGIAAFYCRII